MTGRDGTEERMRACSVVTGRDKPMRQLAAIVSVRTFPMTLSLFRERDATQTLAFSGLALGSDSKNRARRQIERLAYDLSSCRYRRLVSLADGLATALARH